MPQSFRFLLPRSECASLQPASRAQMFRLAQKAELPFKFKKHKHEKESAGVEAHYASQCFLYSCPTA